jgi:glycosyltransferase involved in cell wall biosynthesis
MSEYERVVQRVRALVGATVPAGARVLVVSRGDGRLIDVPGRRAGHFPQTPTGLYAGHHPADGAVAVRELQRLGAGYLVVPETGRWWLEHYDELREWLAAEGEVVADEAGSGVVFALPARRAGTAAPPPTAVADAEGVAPVPFAPVRAPHRRRRRVLFIAHGHPAERAGGAENYALRLHRALRDDPDWEPLFLARSGPPHGRTPRPEGGERIECFDGGGDEHLLFTEGYDFDWLYGTMRHDKTLYTRHLRALLTELRPDVVHFQHTLYIGYDAIREVRRTLPDALIAVTLHEFLPICHRSGQMVRTDGTLCDHDSPQRCHGCFPDIAPARFARRKRFIQAQLGLADLFIAPSRLVRDRYAAWGLPAERILLEDYGHPSPAPSTDRGAPHRTFGFFGQLNPFKGIDVLLDAWREVAVIDRARLHVHGANLDLQERAFRERVEALLRAPGVVDRGPYPPEDVGPLMDAVDWVVVPSVWWENSPLVIAEAFARGRPVICSDLGGMAEKVTHERDGLRFAPGDPGALAAVLRRAATEPALWQRLREGIRPPHGIDAHARTLTAAYERLLR